MSAAAKNMEKEWIMGTKERCNQIQEEQERLSQSFVRTEGMDVFDAKTKAWEMLLDQAMEKI